MQAKCPECGDALQSATCVNAECEQFGIYGIPAEFTLVATVVAGAGKGKQARIEILPVERAAFEQAKRAAPVVKSDLVRLAEELLAELHRVEGTPIADDQVVAEQNALSELGDYLSEIGF